MKPDSTVDLLRDSNPVPQPGRLDIDDAALLLAIDERSGEMSTSSAKRETRGVPDLTELKPPKRPTAWVAAAAGFAVVVAVGFGVTLLASPGSDLPAATAQPSTPNTEPLYESAGDGDAILEFTIPAGPSIMILNHAGSELFEVMSLDEDLNSVIRHVFAQGAYEGTRGLQVAPFEPEVAGLEIMADGSWTVEIRPLAEATNASCANGLSGTGDDLVVFTDFTASSGIAQVSHRGPDTKSFDILAWDDAGNEALLVDAGGDHEEIVEVPTGFRIWDIVAGGTWTVVCG